MNDHDEDAVASLIDALVILVTRHPMMCECGPCDRLHDALHGAVTRALDERDKEPQDG